MISEENSSILTDLDNELRVLGERVDADSTLGGGLLQFCTYRVGAYSR